MTRKRLEPATESVPNLAPMVDVIMVLLIFFLLGATLNLSETGILQTELDPSSGPGQGARVEINPRITIALQSAPGEEGATVTLVTETLGLNAFDTLYEMLRARAGAGADTQNPVVIGADTDVRWQYVVKAMDAAVHAGFRNIQFAVSMRPGS